MNKDNLAFTLVELLAVIVILSIILVITVPSILGLINKVTQNAFAEDAMMIIKAIELEKLKNESFDVTSINENNINDILHLSNANYESLNVSIDENNKPVITIEGKGKWSDLTAYGEFNDMNVVKSEDYDITPPVITILGDNPVEVYQDLIYNDAGATATDNHDGDITADIVVTNTVNSNSEGTYTITYNVSDAAGNKAEPVTRTVNVIFYSNPPLLVSGMTPIKWNGTNWVETTTNDSEWYNYQTKKWANAKTADGSMWVWIPRYIYKISSNWHNNVTGVIDVQFSIGIDDTRSGTISLDEGTTAEASNNKWTNHPAFTFGDDELTGIWIAKFEPSVSNVNDLCYTSPSRDNCDKTTLIPKIAPTVYSWRFASVGNAFTVCRNMEINAVYGWGTSGNGLDTHLMKNTEWGVVVYLSKSIYGKNNEEVWINPVDTYITGCAGDSVSSDSVTSCLKTYETVNGVKASTTGNIYGVYDMSGGAWDRVSAYVDSGDEWLTYYGGSIINADDKYKDIYTASDINDADNNYPLTINHKGDAVYETSGPPGHGAYAWFSDFAAVPNDWGLWFVRGGCYPDGTAAGIFYFNYEGGHGEFISTFRPVLAIGEGL